MTADPAPAVVVDWPISLGPEQLQDFIGSLGLKPDELSPLGRAPDHEPQLDGAGVAESEVAADRDRSELVLALSAFAAPERLLVIVRRTKETIELAWFLATDQTVIRFDWRDGRYTISSPMSLTEFGGWLAGIGSVATSERRDRPPEVLTQRFLLAVGELIACCTGSGTSILPIPLGDAEAAIAQAVASGGNPWELLTALAQSGVVTIEAEAVKLRETWLAEHRYLLDSDPTDLYALELVDAEAGRWVPRSLTLIGPPEDRRVAVMPPSYGPDPLDGAVTVLPATPANVTAAAIAVASAPWRPPRMPPPLSAADLTRWLSEESHEAEHDWMVSSPPQLTAGSPPAGHTVPEALLRPAATIEIATTNVNSSRLHRHVFALGARDGAEWTPEQLLIRWRPLAAGALAERMLAALPRTVAVGEPADLPYDLLLELLTGRAHSTNSLPDALREARADPRYVWVSVGAFVAGVDGSVKHKQLLLASAPERGSWLVETQSRPVRAVPVTAAELVHAVVAGLAQVD